MTHLFGVLNIGTSALLLQQRAIHVTGNNIANVNTPGYSRQRLNIETHEVRALLESQHVVEIR